MEEIFKKLQENPRMAFFLCNFRLEEVVGETSLSFPNRGQKEKDK